MRRGRNKLKLRYGGKKRRDLSEAILAVDEPQHGSNLEAVAEHGQEWVSCVRCGRQWAVSGLQADVVTDGDGFCDDEALRNPVKSRTLTLKGRG